ncbi:MAG: hypothetical protein EBS48_10020, partial [Actinobacteria bacterium]|nr:hypothetical protein [Actinomycetota bacterium]
GGGGAATTAATTAIGVARGGLQLAVGVADVSWAGSVTSAQADYDTLVARGRVEAVKQLADPFVAMRESRARIAGDLRRDLVLNTYDRDVAKETYQSGSGGFTGDWSKNWSTVVGGVVQCAGAVCEIVFGLTTVAASLVMGSTVAGIPVALFSGALGVAATLHGLDTMVAGYQTIVTGVPQRTLTARSLDTLTGSAFASDLIDGAIGMVGGAAAAKVLRLATMTDDMGRCMNMFSRAYLGACFTGDTLVHVTAMADGVDVAEHAEQRSSSTALATATATRCLAIAKVPIGSRVLADNPRPEQFDDTWPEPVAAESVLLSLDLFKADGTVVKGEFLRPREWVERLGLSVGGLLPVGVSELDIDCEAVVTGIGPCPPIAEGEGRVVTGRFITRDAGNLVTVALANGAEIRATDVHPVWSVDREEWVPAGELEPGEQVDTLAGPVAVLSVERLESALDVYNIEVHGEHVFRVTADGVLVHNGDLTCNLAAARKVLGEAPEGMKDPHLHHILFKLGLGAKQRELVIDGQRILRSIGIDPIHGVENLVWAPWRVKGQHSIDALRKERVVFDVIYR